MALSGMAQDKTKLIGNKSRSGSANNSFSVIQGAQVGIKMHAGGKPVQLLKLTFHVDNQANDTIPFKVNVYTFDKLPKDNLVKQEIKGIVIRNTQPNNQEINVDLSPYNIDVKGSIVVSVEFLTTQTGHSLGFSCGLLNGGTYYKKGPDTEWKKMPILGSDFNVVVKKIKR
jgi:hypothetical protein